MLNWIKGNRPDITPAQVVALVFGAVYPVLVLLGVDLDADRQQALEQLRVIAVALFAGDAAIRIGRNYAAGKASQGTGLMNQPPPEDIVDDEAAVPAAVTAAGAGSAPLPVDDQPEGDVGKFAGR